MSARAGCVRGIAKAYAGYDCPSSKVPLSEGCADMVGGWSTVIVGPEFMYSLNEAALADPASVQLCYVAA